MLTIIAYQLSSINQTFRCEWSQIGTPFDKLFADNGVDVSLANAVAKLAACARHRTLLIVCEFTAVCNIET